MEVQVSVENAIEFGVGNAWALVIICDEQLADEELFQWLLRIPASTVLDAVVERIDMSRYGSLAPAEIQENGGNGAKPFIYAKIQGKLQSNGNDLDSLLSSTHIGSLREKMTPVDRTTFVIESANVDLGAMAKCLADERDRGSLCIYVHWTSTLLLQYLKCRKMREEAVLRKFDVLKTLPVVQSKEFFREMCRLASEQGIRSGHWSCYLDWESQGEKISAFWRQLLCCFFRYKAQGPPLAAFKVHCKTSVDGYALAAHNEDFTGLALKDKENPDFQAVFHFERFMRQAGLIRVLKYKPDVYSLCGIIHSAPQLNSSSSFWPRPTILQSKFKVKSQESEISSNYTPNYAPEIDCPLFRNRIEKDRANLGCV